MFGSVAAAVVNASGRYQRHVTWRDIFPQAESDDEQAVQGRPVHEIAHNFRMAHALWNNQNKPN